MAFVKGQSGNPSGRPKKLLPDGRSLSDLAKDHTQDAVQALVDILGEDGAPHAARVSAATALLDRGWGKPSQSVELTGDADNPLRLITEIKLTPVSPE